MHKKRGNALPPYLVNLKSNTMKKITLQIYVLSITNTRYQMRKIICLTLF